MVTPEWRNSHLKSLVWSVAAGLLAVALASQLSLRTSAQDTDQEDPAKFMKVSGTVSSVQLRDEEKIVKAAVTMNISAENIGKDNLIILRRPPDSVFESLSNSETADQPMWSAAHRPQIERGSADRKWEKLQAALEKAEPDDDNSIILSPGDSMGWNIVVQLNIAKVSETSVNAPGGQPARTTWQSVQKSCPCWLRFDASFWPMSLEPKSNGDDPAFGKKLAKRWRKKGLLVLGEKRSEPIPIQLPAR
ncbi:MAG TPA: hypothetical protein VE783_06050 [Candidatus Limnocylindrales bacterium]|jgi:hypothetical protein|nr:hypothetical protein [Candidatus Limnocylindrales bacterium]